MIYFTKSIDTMSSVTSTAYNILSKENRPVKCFDLTNQILKKVKLETKTPEESVRSILSLNPKFMSYGKGYYGLSEWGFHWFREFYMKGYYFSLSDLCYLILKDKKKMAMKDILKIIGNKYPGRYKFTSGSSFTNVKNDLRFNVTDPFINLKNWNKKSFLPLDIDEFLLKIEKVLLESMRPLLFKKLISKISIDEAPIRLDIPKKKIILLWLFLDDRFQKMGPKGYWGLKKWLD